MRVSDDGKQDGILRWLRVFERWIVIALVGMMVLVVVAGTVRLALNIADALFAQPGPALGSAELLDLFGFFS